MQSNSSPTSYHKRVGCHCGCPRGDLWDPSCPLGKCSWRPRCLADMAVGVTFCSDLWVGVYSKTNQTPVLIRLGFCIVFGRACTIPNHFRLKAENLILPRFPPELHFRTDFAPPLLLPLQWHRCTLVSHKTVIKEILHVFYHIDASYFLRI